MSNENYSGNGGRNIIPSARRSIHGHSPSISTNRDEMRHREDSDDSSGDERRAARWEGIDEVDNVMSKMRYQMRDMRRSMTPPHRRHLDDYEDRMWPPSRRHQMREMRRSVTPPSHRFPYDSEIYTLAKSLPATLPSHSNYSDDFDACRRHRTSSRNHMDRTQECAASPMSISSSIDSLNSSYSTHSPNLSPRLNRSSYRSQQRITSGGTLLMSLLALLSVLSAGYYCDIFKSSFGGNHVIYDELRFYSDLNELGAKYKVGDNSILQLQAGISTIYKRQDTSCLIFVYNSMRENFDPNKFDDFVDNVASNAAKFLRNDTASVRHVVVDGSDLTMRTHSQLVKEYREDIARTGVLLVRNIEHVPSHLAMAFHYYCDEYNPLVKKSAIFFTLNNAKCQNSEEKSSHASVEKCLKEKWKTVPNDNIGPLLTRVVSIVVDSTGF